ncbi:uncharacterized protein DEA37_0004741 [Paragonimus westermani]|uniref:Reverse transcriptase domain-containing protein n=1 Tax=Paragonimus westermani TaxID=34504 RepID=A0A5J4NL59_9TREM|nr:uncharacterized protein DEA37_0004741 [Paragonimus westermani]
MTGSPYHRLAQWLVSLIEPVRSRLAVHSLKDTFEFVELTSNINVKHQIVTSFDVESLFTNVLLDEVINIVCNYATEHKLALGISIDELWKLLKMCTSNIQSVFNGTYYRQIDGVAMGSPLGPVLADIFMGHLEHFMSTEIRNTLFYKRYVDDIFAVFDGHWQVTAFHKLLNGLHNKLTFTLEFEQNERISFLDVLLKRREDGSLSRGVYRKSTWTGQYLHFKSFTPIAQKRGLVRTLFHRFRRIATDDELESELTLLHETLIENGDSVSALIKRRSDAALKRTYNAARLVYVDETIRVPTTPRKDVVPLFAQSNIVYTFDCICGSRYVGRTRRHLGTRINEHIPKWLLNSGVGCAVSAIKKHLLQTGH